MGKRQHEWALSFGKAAQPDLNKEERRQAQRARTFNFSYEGQAYKELMQVHDEERGDWRNDE